MIALSAKPQEPIEYSLIAVEYIGDSDKPVTPIVISDSKAGISWYRDAVLKGNQFKLTYVHVVNVPLMVQLVATAQKYKAIAEQVATQSKSPTTVSITLVTPQAKNTFMLHTRSALSLMEDLSKLSTAERSLQADLSHFANRIAHLSN
jgi:hypothetical protein